MSSEQDATEASPAGCFDASVGAMEVLTVYLGDRLGPYRSLARADRTAAELASDAGIEPRYAREWLEQQAAAGILGIDPSAPEEGRRFSLPSAHAEALVDPESPAAMAASRGRWSPLVWRSHSSWRRSGPERAFPGKRTGTT